MRYIESDSNCVVNAINSSCELEGIVSPITKLSSFGDKSIGSHVALLEPPYPILVPMFSMMYRYFLIILITDEINSFYFL